MSNLASKVWAELYPDRRPWAQLEPDTQAEWTRVVEVVVQLVGVRELKDALEKVMPYIIGDRIVPWKEASATLIKAREVMNS